MIGWKERWRKIVVILTTGELPQEATLARAEQSISAWMASVEMSRGLVRKLEKDLQVAQEEALMAKRAKVAWVARAFAAEKRLVEREKTDVAS